MGAVGPTGQTAEFREFSPQFCHGPGAFSSAPLVYGSQMCDLLPGHKKKLANAPYTCFFFSFR